MKQILVKAIKYLGVEASVSDNLRLKSILADLNSGFNSDTTIILLFQKKGFAEKVLNNLAHPSKINEKNILKDFKKISGYSDKQCKWAFSIWQYALGKSKYPITLQTVIKFFKVIDYKKKILSGDEITIIWDVVNYSRINLVKNNTVVIDITGRHFYKFKPTQNTSLHLEIKNDNFSSLSKSSIIYLNVLKRIDLSFSSDRKITIQGLPIKLSWNAQNATSVSIRSNKGDEYNNLLEHGEVEVFPSKDCIYTITAKHDLQTKEEKAYLYIKKAPSILNLNMPDPPSLTLSLSSIHSSQLESNITHYQNTKNTHQIEKVLKNSSKMYDFILNKISSNSIVEKINTYIYNEKISK